MVVLTKTDLCDDVAGAVAQARAVVADTPVLAVSARTGEGMAALAEMLKPGETAVLLGSSGAGKSTLVNTLAGADIMATQQVRERDGRGRHTTTHRELVRLPSGVLLLDTPGMRELALWEAEAAVADLFEDIAGARGALPVRGLRPRRRAGLRRARGAGGGRARSRTLRRLGQAAARAGLPDPARGSRHPRGPAPARRGQGQVRAGGQAETAGAVTPRLERPFGAAQVKTQWLVEHHRHRGRSTAERSADPGPRRPGGAAPGARLSATLRPG